MKISSKSILSPGRPGVRDPQHTLSTSLSRRLKNSGSLKGGASPAMFPAKKRGTFDNPEPSSPKVTCIGQVRVRNKKKQAKKLRTLSRRHSDNEVSFRKVEHTLTGFCSKSDNHQESLNLGPKGVVQRNQENQESLSQRSWVHFPVTICEALRAFGSEFSCLIPCRTERGKEEKNVVVGDGNRQGSCGVFARWLVAVQDGDGGGSRDIELVVGDEEEEEEDDDDIEVIGVRKRRHVFEDLEIVDGRIEGHKDEARVSVCVPPKNALLLMRCRSDPMKSEALVNRSWEPIFARNEEEDEDLVDDEHQVVKDLKECQASVEVEQKQVMDVDQDQENVQQVEAKLYQDQEIVQQDEANQDEEVDNVQYYEVGQDLELDQVQQYEANQDEELDNVQKYEVGQDQEHDNVQQYAVGQDQEYEQTEAEEEESFYLVSLFEEIINQDCEIQEQNEAHEEVDDAETGAEKSIIETEFDDIIETHEQEMVNEIEEHNNGVSVKESEVKEKSGNEEVLPECLLLMMHEPKLSLNVSKETWVCSTDFIKRRSNSRRKPPAPPPPPIKLDGGDESSATTITAATLNDVMRVADDRFPTVLPQPARSSCSLPVAPWVLEQKLANAVGYEPFVLTRCKSEPMKTAASKLLPESCVWENRKLERVTFGVGAAGLGF